MPVRGSGRSRARFPARSGRQAFGGFIQDHQVGLVISARRSTASAARRRTVARRHGQPLREAGEGRNTVHRSSRGRRPRRARRHDQVFADRQVGEDAAAFGHVGHAQPAFFRRPASDVTPYRPRRTLARSPSASGSAWSCPCRCGRADPARGRRDLQVDALEDMAVAVVGVDAVEFQHGGSVAWASPR